MPTLRFARGWSAPRTDLLQETTSVADPEGKEAIPATRISPPGSRRLPGWLVLHGLTVPGRGHPALLRFTRALASAGRRVLIPEIREWTELRFAPDRAQAVIEAAVTALAEDPATAPGGVVLSGFSFGGPQALLAASSPRVAVRLRGVVAWGSYADLETATAFQFTGEHGYGGTLYRQRPDPYGRWVIGANCLNLVPGLDDEGEVAGALHRLASLAGRLQIPSIDPSLEPTRRKLRRAVSPARLPLFDLFAPPRSETPHRERALEVVKAMVGAARNRVPLLDPVPGIERVPVPVRLLHGRDDLLIPFTQTRALAERLRGRTPDLACRITGLFSHSGHAGADAGSLARAREGIRFLGALQQVFQVG
jgi:pimeloyl-ACP methyl ester carboxylesterase